MADFNIIYQGEDKDVTFTLKDVNGDTIDLNSYTGIICNFSELDGTVIARYSREAYTYEGIAYNTADFEQLDQVTNKGQFKLHMQRSVTRSITANCKVQFEIKVLNVDARHTDSEFTTVAIVTTDDTGKPLEVRYTSTKYNQGFD